MVPCRLGDVLTGCSKSVAGPPGTQETFDLQVVARLPVPACNAPLCASAQIRLAAPAGAATVRLLQRLRCQTLE